MRWQSKSLFVLMVALAIGAAGCGGKKKQDPGAEAMDLTPDADTAMVDDGSNTAEAAPVIDDAKPSAAEDSSAAGEAKPVSDTEAAADSGPPPEVKLSGDMASYTVQKGDTLMKIAFNIYGDIGEWKNLYDWNKDTLKKASQLEKGTRLKYQKPDSEPTVARNGDPYLIKKGDTLAKIADDIYAKANKWKRLWDNNRSLIRNPNRIYAGFYLYYQITEQERKMAEDIKAKRGGGGSSADAGMPGAEPAAAAPAPKTVKAAAPAAPAQTGASNGLGALTRMPAAAPAGTK